MNKNLLFLGKIDTYVVFNPVNRFYLTDMNTSFGCAIITAEKDFFITDFRYQIEAKEKLASFELHFVKYAELYDKIAAICTDIGAKNIGFEENRLTHAEYLKLKKTLKGLKFLPCGALFEEIRAIKSEDEISRIREAQAITEKALTETLKLLKPRVTERELSAEITYQMLVSGADGPAFDNIVAFGANAAKPHYNPGDARFEKNDIALFDIGAKYKGYCADMSRTFALSEPSPKLRELYKIVLEAQEYALKNIRAGITLAQADSYAREYITANGYGKEFGHSLGHGVGIEIHECPSLSANAEGMLKENMVVTVEPGIYLEGIGGVRIEDLVVVKKDGVINLTTYKKELLI